jgi:hypothetical protein
MVSIVKKRKKLTTPPHEFIIGAKKEGEDDGGDLDDDAVICSCHVSSSAPPLCSIPLKSLADPASISSLFKRERLAPVSRAAVPTWAKLKRKPRREQDAEDVYRSSPTSSRRR